MPIRNREKFSLAFKITLSVIVALLVLYIIWTIQLIGKYGASDFAARAGVIFWGAGLILIVVKIAVFLKVFFDQVSDEEDRHYSKNIRR